jgi:hypothetical protein
MNRLDEDVLNAHMLLAAAIVQSAIDEYKRAVKAGNKTRMAYLEKWFKGEWCSMLTFDQGALILEQLKKELGIFKGGSDYDR